MHWEFDFWVQKPIVAFHLALVTSQKLFNWIKEWGRYVVFGVRGV